VSALRVRYFAALRDALGCEEERIPVDGDGLSLAALRGRLVERHGEAAGALGAPGVRVAVNQAFAESPDPWLAPGDEVAFLPPVTGG
jgi:molybdopterin synthase sulfur carrier subunit